MDNRMLSGLSIWLYENSDPSEIVVIYIQEKIYPERMSDNHIIQETYSNNIYVSVHAHNITCRMNLSSPI